MDARADTYWSIEACAWVVASPGSTDLPVQRSSDDSERDVDLDEVDQPSGAPV